MTRWLERKEKMARHRQYVAWRQQIGISSGELDSKRPDWVVSGLDQRRFLHLAKYPAKNVSLESIQSLSTYGAIHLLPALSRLIAWRPLQRVLSHPHPQDHC
jgi:hypothetical protein